MHALKNASLMARILIIVPIICIILAQLTRRKNDNKPPDDLRHPLVWRKSIIGRVRNGMNIILNNHELPKAQESEGHPRAHAQHIEFCVGTTSLFTDITVYA